MVIVSAPRAREGAVEPGLLAGQVLDDLAPRLSETRVWGSEVFGENGARTSTPVSHYQRQASTASCFKTAEGTGDREVGEGGFHFYRARFYQPSIGRFIQEDPARRQDSGSKYLYAAGSPTEAVDPDGRVVRLGGRDENGKLREEVARQILESDIPGKEILAGLFEVFAARRYPATPEEMDELRRGLEWGEGMPVAAVELCQIHHIATDKAIKTGYTAILKRIFERAGLSLQIPENLLALAGHRGRHSAVYHRWVIARLQGATEGLAGDAAKDMLILELRAIREELAKNPEVVRGVFR